MKTIMTSMLCSLLTITGIAQTTSKVTLIFKSMNSATKNYQAQIDGISYYSNTNTQSSANNRVILNNTPIGAHTLKVFRLKNNSAAYNGRAANTLVYTKTFELRQGYDMNITILTSGSVQFREQEVADINYPVAVNTPMATSSFNALTQSIRDKWSQSLKSEAIRDAVINTNNYFSTLQIRQLLTLITSESDRLDLAKLAYARATDLNNYASLSTLFNSSANKSEFSTYVRTNGGQVAENTARAQMTDYNFNKLSQSVRDKWSQGLKGDAIKEAFVNTNNYFSTAQARQLLAMITSESDRLELAKLSYRGITDPSSFPLLVDMFGSSSYKTEFNNYVRSNGGQVVYINTTKAQITDYEFNRLMQSVRDKWSQGLKGEAVREAFVNTNNYFSTAQIRQLLVMISSESDRLELAKLSYRGITDPANFSQLAEVFTGANRTEFNTYAYAQSGQTVPVPVTVRTPMASADFDYLVLSVRANFLQLLKVSAETNIFNSPNNYFSTSQAKQLIALINLETSRLELAKLAYRTLTDRENFSQLNELFQSQANRDALASYAKNYKEYQ